jgi:hypothetical protein
MTGAPNTMTNELKPCPFCGKDLYRRPRQMNDYGRCETEGCWAHERKITVPVDDHRQVAAWNTRVPPSPSSSLSGEDVEELDIQALASAIHDARYDQGRDASTWSPFDAEPHSGKVYCLRIANAVLLHLLAALRSSPTEEAVAAERLRIRDEIVNTPETADFMVGVPLEALHQRERWGAAHDAGKTALDWYWLLGYLGQKAARAAEAGDIDKAKHHTISTAAALANWHAALSGADTAMRPGIDPVEHGIRTPQEQEG